MFIDADIIFEKMNQLGKAGTPFFFMIDFDAANGYIGSKKDTKEAGILFDFGGRKNFVEKKKVAPNIILKKYPLSIDKYKESFDIVYKNLKAGNSYLTNLTAETPIDINISLDDIFHFSQARYKLLLKNRFVVFSPEIFVQIRNNTIYSFPMKGTIDAAVRDAPERILSDAKEKAEHDTIVDLIRNDLSIIATNVHVKRYRYIEELKTCEKNLLQVSSEIAGTLPSDCACNIGDIVKYMLPAGSISGAPKKKTVDIIKSAEKCERGFFTGVMGYFDGKDLDSAVMIRFIKKGKQQFVFCSGGGITVNSVWENEYKEMIDKVYVPIF
jgi:para-aminobenzoate synthetase component I